MSRAADQCGTRVIKAVLIMVGSAWLALPSHVQASTFAPFTRVQIEGPYIYAPPWGKALGDIDGDGYPDIAAGFGGEFRRIYWYQYPTWSKHRISDNDGGEDIQLADVNNDGSLDVVTATSDTLDGVAWYENPRGRGGNPATDTWTRHIIESPVNFFCGHDVLAGDLNADGKIDVVIRVEEGPTYVYLQNNSDSWTKILISTAPNGQGIALLDVNRDGKLDLVENGFWLEQPSDPVRGTWVRHNFAAYANDSGVMLGDVNKDGRVDVVLSPEEHGSDRISWFEQPADPINGTWIEHVVLNPANYVHRVRLGDFNRDGTIDIAFAEMSNSTTQRVGVLYNNDGIGTSWSLQVLATTAGHNIAVDDIDGDGDLDIINADWADNGVLELYRNNVNNALPLDSWHYTQIDATRSTASFGLNFGDIDGDGHIDVVSGPYWYHNPGGDLSGPWTRFDLPPGMDGMLALDVDGDGWLDIIAEGSISGSSQLGVYWLRNNGQGSTWTTVLVGTLTPDPDTFESRGYALGQIVPGGLPEIVLTSGLGAYYFQVPANPTQGNWPIVLISADVMRQGIAMADINGDGKLDLVGTLSPGGTTVSWWQNPGSGSGNWFRRDVGTTSGVPGGRVAAADINRDGRVDIVVSEANLTASGNSLFWFAQPTNVTGGTWVQGTVATGQGSLNSLDVGDINLDGKPDIITGEYRGNLYVSVWENVNKGASFTQHIVSSGRESYLGARLIDLDRDGAQEIVSIAADTYPLLHLWRNNAFAPDATLPLVSITTPTDGDIVSGTTTVTASASDNVGVAGVQFRLDGINFGAEVTAAPYSVTWDTTTSINGIHKLTAVARDFAGNNGTSTDVTVMVNNTTPPVITSVSASAITTSGATVTWTTDRPSNSQVDYGNATPYTSSTVPDPALVSAHSVALSGLSGNTLYHYRVDSIDASGNLAVSPDFTFTTLATGSYIPSAGLISWWKFDESSGTIAADALGSNPGVLTNFACATLNCNSTEGWSSSGKYQNALNFKGSGDLVNAGQKPSVNDLQSFSYLAWIYPRSLGQGNAGRIIEKSGATGYKRLRLNNSVSSSLRVEVSFSTTNAVATSGSNAVTTNQWQHVVMTFDGPSKTLRLYRNGVQVASATGVGTMLSEAAGNLTIGNNPAGTNTFDGLIDDVQVYNRALTPIEISNVYTNTPDTTAPVISAVASTAGTNTATITWTTDKPSDSQVEYGADTSYGMSSPLDSSLVTSHSVSLSRLATGTQYHFRVDSRDSYGNLARSTDFTFSTQIPDTIPPTVALTSPAANSIVFGSTTASATATDNVDVASVQFLLDGAALGAVATAPYNISWDTTTTANGTHTLTAMATDTSGNTATSAAVSVTVSNTNTIAFAQGVGITSDISSTTIALGFTTTTGAGNLMVAAISWGSNATVSCSDSQGNTYAVATTQFDPTNNQSLAVCYAANIKGGSDTITATFSASASYRRLLIHEYRGIAGTGPLDVAAKSIGNGSTTSNAITSTSATPTASGDLVFGAVMDDAGLNNIAAGSGFTLRQSLNNKDLASEDFVQSSSGSVAATFTFSAAHRYLAQMVTFKAAGPVGAPPTVTTPAAATPNPLTGTTTNLSVLGADNSGETNLIYTWATTGTPPAAVTFSPTGTNAAKSTVATFTKAGSYSFQVTIKNPSNLTATSSVNVTVNQTLTAISVAPLNATVAVGATQQFTATATDQFSSALALQPSFDWTVTGAGSISSTGLFTANTAGGPYTVTASSAGVNGTATVTVASTVISYMQGANGTGNASATSISQTFATANSSGDLIVVAVSWGSNGSVTCSDSLGNTYTLATTQYDSVNNQSLAICYATNVRPGSNTVQAKFSTSASYRRLAIHEYSGVATVGAVDATAKNVANGTTAANAITSGSATTSANGDLIFGAVMDDMGTTSIAAGTGFIQRQSVNNKALATEDLVQAAAGPIAATQTFGAAHRYLAQMVAFKYR